MITVQTADNALKSFYLDAVKESIDLKANPLLAEIAKTSSDVYGKDVRKVVRFGFNGGVGAGSETGDLPAASTNNYGVLVSTLKNLYGTLQISDKALKAGQGGEGAFVDLLNDEMQSLIKSASFNLGRMLYGDGTGELTSVTMTGEDALEVASTKGVLEGMTVHFRDTSGKYLSNVSGRKIVNVDRKLSKIYLDNMEGITTSTVPMGASISLQVDANSELTGLGAIFSNSAKIYGADRESNSMLKPYMETVSDISENAIQKAIDEIEEISGSRVNFIVCSWGVKRAIAEYFKNNHVMLPTMELNSGYSAMSFNGIPIVADRFCPNGTMYLLNTNDFKLHQLCDWEWLEGEDGKVLKQVPGKPVYTATLVKYAELLCERPCGQGMISGIKES